MAVPAGMCSPTAVALHSSPSTKTMPSGSSAWRLQQARADQIAPFMVFSDATLRALAALPPNGLGPTTLAMVPGIGPAKLARYGDALLSLLQGAAEAPDGTK